MEKVAAPFLRKTRMPRAMVIPRLRNVCRYVRQHYHWRRRFIDQANNDIIARVSMRARRQGEVAEMYAVRLCIMAVDCAGHFHAANTAFVQKRPHVAARVARRYPHLIPAVQRFFEAYALGRRSRAKTKTEQRVFNSFMDECVSLMCYGGPRPRFDKMVTHMIHQEFVFPDLLGIACEYRQKIYNSRWQRTTRLPLWFCHMLDSKFDSATLSCIPTGLPCYINSNWLGVQIAMHGYYSHITSGLALRLRQARGLKWTSDLARLIIYGNICLPGAYLHDRASQCLREEGRQLAIMCQRNTICGHNRFSVFCSFSRVLPSELFLLACYMYSGCLE